MGRIPSSRYVKALGVELGTWRVRFRYLSWTVLSCFIWVFVRLVHACELNRIDARNTHLYRSNADLMKWCPRVKSLHRERAEMMMALPLLTLSLISSSLLPLAEMMSPRYLVKQTTSI